MKQSKDEATDIVQSSTAKKQQQSTETLPPKDALDVLEAINTIIKSYLPSPTSPKFDLEEFRDKVFLDKQYSVNKTWYNDHTVMSCPAKHFLERFSVQGEFFEKYD